MQKARQTLLQIGGIILCVNGALWFMSNVRDAGPMTFGQFVFRIIVFLLGLLFVSGAGAIWVLEKIQSPSKPEPKPEPRVIDKSDLIVEQPDNSSEEQHE